MADISRLQQIIIIIIVRRLYTITEQYRASKRNWPLSQQCNKASGSCSVYHATCQLHHVGGTVHLHGSRHNRCPGSNKLPAAAVSSSQPFTGSLPEDFLRIIDTSTTAPIAKCAATIYHPNINAPIIKHIPKSARSACANLFNDIITKAAGDVKNLSNWHHLLNFAASLLLKPPRTGQSDNLTSIIKKRVATYVTGKRSPTPSSHVRKPGDVDGKDYSDY